MNSHMNKSKDFIYFPFKKESSNTSNKKFEDQGEQNLSLELLEDLLKSIGREILKERTPTLEELEQTLQESIRKKEKNQDKYNKENDFDYKNDIYPTTTSYNNVKSNKSIITTLIKKGYLKNSEKWLSSKGFVNIGGKILQDVMKELKKGDFGIHETKNFGYGSLLLDTTKKYEIGDDFRLINVPNSLINSIQRLAKKNGKIEIPNKI